MVREILVCITVFFKLPAQLYKASFVISSLWIRKQRAKENGDLMLSSLDKEPKIFLLSQDSVFVHHC